LVVRVLYVRRNMEKGQYITAGELKAINALVEFLEDGPIGVNMNSIGVQGKMFDLNGEPLGTVEMSDGGAFAYHPNGRDEGESTPSS
jgi:hypothetical protein